MRFCASMTLFTALALTGFGDSLQAAIIPGVNALVNGDAESGWEHPMTRAF
jgi:hypothetical protein